MHESARMSEGVPLASYLAQFLGRALATKNQPRHKDGTYAEARRKAKAA